MRGWRGNRFPPGVPGHPTSWGPEKVGRDELECTPGPGGSTSVSGVGDLLFEAVASLCIKEGLMSPWAVTVSS